MIEIGPNLTGAIVTVSICSVMGFLFWLMARGER